ncbi:inositol monophosphatase [Aneurinibacillus sp. Ricciae_BoGa-3]|uniref:inositol monophosphatase family protein n=1 Tax=Aneurinibacillus sp. Ricciae_BoGa-3 TaxID=3022697 RepID=UPI002340E837|nr:inositol monophosphatase [Aneurinibacillus sp. Ricciae_BoGa-3]WCK56654.1 inositol monophosphatase [Aneurinibacillus sp. Ricciae_BoGa-3]
MWNNYLSFAKELVKECGEIIKANAGNAGTETFKSKTDIVTAMDLEAENWMIKRIQEHFPEHRIFSEEVGAIGNSGDFEWVIDPIDGTVNYSVGLPFYGISLALVHSGQTVVAATSLPALGEIFWASAGGGAFLNGKKIKVRDASLAEAFVSFGDFSKEGNRQSNHCRLAALSAIANEVFRIRMVGSAALSLAYIACGRLDAAVYVRPNRYDVVGGMLLIQEAGGIRCEKAGYTVYGSQKVTNPLAELLPEL